MKFLKALFIEVLAGELKNTIQCHKKGESVVSEIKDDAFEICQSLAEDGYGIQ